MSKRTEEAGRGLRVALLSDDPSFRSMVRSGLEASIPEAQLVCDAEVSVSGLTQKSLEKLLSYQPDLVFLDLGERTALGARFISALTGRAPVTVVAAGSPVAADGLLALVRAGATEYLPRPVDDAEVSAACARIVGRLGRGEAVREEHRAGRVITVYSPKGGTGVTTTAVNLAVRIRKATGKQVLLLDLSDGMGGAGVLLGLEPRYSYLDVVQSLHRLDERLLDSFLEEHETGVKLLAAPLDVETGRAVAPEKVGQLLRLVRRYCDYAVVDVGRGLDRVARVALESADERLLLATPDLPTLRNVKRALDEVAPDSDEGRTISEQRKGSDGVRLVVNRSGDLESLSRKEIERAIGLPVFHLLPRDDGPVLRGGNLGRPVVGDVACAFSTAVEELGDRLAADDLPETNGRRPLGRFIQAVLHPFSGDRPSRREPARRPSKSNEPKTGTEGAK